MSRRIPPARVDSLASADAPALDPSFLAALIRREDPSGGDLMVILERAQRHCGYLSESIIEEIARLTGIPPSRIYGVVTFYEPFSTVPPARHTICVCEGTACHVRGGDEVVRATQEILGVASGESTPDGWFHLETVACVGTCAFGPLAIIDGQLFSHLTATEMPSVIDQFRDPKGSDLHV